MLPQGLCKTVLVFLFVRQEAKYLLAVPTEVRGLLEVRQLLQCASALRPHYCSYAQRTLVIRIIEWFDMVVSVAGQAKSANTCVSCDSS
jgi:hypothetical protein